MITRLFRKNLQNYGPFLVLLLFILGLWEMLARIGVLPPFILPGPLSIGTALVENSKILFGLHLPATLQEVLLGYVLSVTCGTLLGLGMHTWRPLEKALYPFIIISQTIPLIALSPVFIMWFGYTLWSKVAVVFLTAFFPVVVGAYDGLQQKNHAYEDLLRTMGASTRQILLKTRIPLALPSYFSGLKLSMVYCVIGATIGEWLGGSKGLGYFSRRMAGNLQSKEMFAAVVLLSAMGVGLFLIIAMIEKIIFKKRGFHK
ncbi:ABC transporter permease [Paenibacillus agri]|uniref:ABC transporter permease n=1 Tax=Paenibacillus agri TaxID=2744309 RepID=A0A850EXL3_9BACL|nr:ABC transporter permease [Paenibacillus agri]NUU64294.1 ABC transporter permease [Paenibacillus agri]